MVCVFWKVEGFLEDKNLKNIQYIQLKILNAIILYVLLCVFIVLCSQVILIHYCLFSIDPPVVYSFRQQDIIEGTNLSVTCNYSSGNPSPTTFLWTQENNQSFKQYGTVLQLPTIQKSESGTYICTAENNLTNTKKGNHSQSMVVNVLCKLI